MTKYFKSLSFKGVVVVLVIDALTLLVFGVLIKSSFDRQLREQFLEDIFALRSFSIPVIFEPDETINQELAQNLIRLDIFEMIYFNEQGVVTHGLDAGQLGTAVPYPAVRAYLDIHQYLPQGVINLDRAQGRDVLKAILSLNQNGANGQQQFLYLEVGADELVAPGRLFLSNYLLTTGIIMVLHFVIISVIYRHSILKRLVAIKDMVQAVSQGNFSAGLRKSHSSDELGLLQEGVGQMTIQIQEMFTEQAEQLRRVTALQEDLLAREREIRGFNEKLEERVRLRTMELEQANHDLESFAYSISHDLRTPLQVINGYAELLESRVGTDPKTARYLLHIRENIAGIDQQINDLLEFSRLGRTELSLQTVDLNRMIQIVLDAQLIDAEDQSIDVRVDDHPLVEADPTMLQQIYTHLISNAVKYTRLRQPRQIHIGYADPGDEVAHFFVRDNGCGFDLRDADRVFALFQRLHRNDEIEGNGVGLALVKRAVERHGGQIWVKSAPDAGSTFCFTLWPTNHQSCAGD
ncbi:MAG: hypothetical protein JW750_08890 [Anaerolineaceae bacterium]|nr:hypothetical protein [Anaerolineaceae bacterium]